MPAIFARIAKMPGINIESAYGGGEESGNAYQVDGVDISDVVHLKLVEERTVLERLQDNEHNIIDGYLGTLSASLGLRNSVLLHERCFLAVEGETEQQAFPVLLPM